MPYAVHLLWKWLIIDCLDYQSLIFKGLAMLFFLQMALEFILLLLNTH